MYFKISLRGFQIVDTTEKEIIFPTNYACLKKYAFFLVFDNFLRKLISFPVLREKIICLRIVLFESLRNCKTGNKGNFTLKPNSNKIMLCGGEGQHYLVLNKIST